MNDATADTAAETPADTPADMTADPTTHEQSIRALGDDERFMARARALARKGINTTHPNPRVGCVIVSDGAVVGEGWHRLAGEAHAEIIALRQAGKRAQGATLYLTLEPCNYHGKTPPCVVALIKAGIRRAVIAMEDPNPKVNGSAISALQEAGIVVTLEVGKRLAQKLNRGFCQRMLQGRPWVTLKMAISLDGKTAIASGESQWITSQAARSDAHKLRAASSAILTGVGTVLRDDPKMSARPNTPGDAPSDASEDTQRQPLRVILDSHLSIPRQAKILQPPGRALIITTAGNDQDAEMLRRDNVEVITCDEHTGQIDLRQVMSELAAREINELMVEAGPRLSGSMLKSQLVDQMIIYMAPDLLGNDARGMFNIPALANIADKHRLAFRDVRMIGQDLRLSLDIIAPQADIQTDIQPTPQLAAAAG